LSLTEPNPSEKNQALGDRLGSPIALPGLSERDYQIAQDHVSQTETWMNDIFADFYNAILAYTPTADFFLAETTPRTSVICTAGICQPLKCRLVPRRSSNPNWAGNLSAAKIDRHR